MPSKKKAEYTLDDFKQQIEMVCIERGLEPEEVMEAIQQSIASAYRKEFGDKEKYYEADFNQEDKTYNVYEVTTVVENVENEFREVSLIDARLYSPNARIGEKIRKEVKVGDKVEFGRIAAQVARQVLFQSINSIRHTKVLQKFKDRIGDVVNVEVDYFKRGGYVVKLAQTSGFISRDNLLPIDKFKPGQVVKALIQDITEDDKGNSRVQLSRSHPDFVKAIIRNEIPEVESGVVTIDKIAREAGSRSKIFVSVADDENVDPVGTILGRKNVRIINIMREISTSMTEKIDIIENNPDDLELMIMDSLEPAEIEKVEIDFENNSANVFCYSEEAALAVGRGGVNIKLASRLLDMELNIVTLENEESSGNGFMQASDDLNDGPTIM